MIFNKISFILIIPIVLASDLDCEKNEFCTHRNNCTTTSHNYIDLKPCSGSDINLICCPSPTVSSQENEEVCGDFNKLYTFTFDKLALVEEYPWTALLGYTSKNGVINTTQFLCAGSLISSRYVLTAAHCLHLPNHELKFVRLGETHLNTEKDCDFTKCAPPFEDVPFDEVIPHSHFDDVTLKHDIALIKLENDVSYTVNIKPICLPFKKHIEFRNEIFTINGWGLIKYGELGGLTKMHTADVRVYGTKKCARLLDRPIADKMICALRSQLDDDVCVADGGGALMYNDYTALKAYLYAVASHNTQEMCDNNPMVYTLVQPYLHWILRHTNENK